MLPPACVVNPRTEAGELLTFPAVRPNSSRTTSFGIHATTWDDVAAVPGDDLLTHDIILVIGSFVRCQHLLSRLAPSDVTQRYNDVYIALVQDTLLDDGTARGNGLVALVGVVTQF